MIIEYPSQSRVRIRSQKDPAIQYWSAFVRLEYPELPRLWESADADFVLISARVRIPLADGTTLERSFPLFTIENRRVESQSGLDLLKKFPLSEQAREQVTITLEARFIKDKEALDHVREIIASTSKAAEPYSANYPVASQILSTVVDLADRIIPHSDEPPSSATFGVDPEVLQAHPERRLKTFLLLPFSDAPSSTSQSSQAATSSSGSVTPVATGFDLSASLVECSNFEGRLCVPTNARDAGPYETARFKDAVYVTIEFRPYGDVLDDGLLLSEASGNCKSITPEALQRAREYLAANSALFSPDDVDGVRFGHRVAQEYAAVADAMVKRDVPALMNLADSSEDSYDDSDGGVGRGCGRGQSRLVSGHGKMLCSCLDRLWRRSPAIETWQMWLLYRGRVRYAPEQRGSANDEAFRLDLLGLGLQRLAVISSRDFNLAGSVWQGTNSPILRLLEMEAASVKSRQIDGIKEATCANAADAEALASQVSVYCDECWSKLMERCKGQHAVLDKARRERLPFVAEYLEKLVEE